MQRPPWNRSKWWSPQVRDVALAALFAVGYFTAIEALQNVGVVSLRWYPQADVLFIWWLVGFVTIAVLVARERFPLLVLVAVVLLYPVAYGGPLRSELHFLPVLLATFTVAEKGRVRIGWNLALAQVAAIAFAVFPMYAHNPLISVQLLTHQGLWPQTVDNGLTWIPLHLTVQVLTVGALLLGRAQHQQRIARAELSARNRELMRLRVVETEQVVIAERARIARELHDVVAHHISAVVLRAQAADRVADLRPDEPRTAVRWIATDGHQALVAMRQVVRVLRSTRNGGELAPQATLAELPEIAQRMAAVGLPVELRVPATVPPLPDMVELAVVRIVQEALTNVLVHAEATRAMVEVTLAAGEIRLTVHDDGSTARIPKAAPLPKPATAESALGGNGLIGMRERAASCGGQLTIGSSPLGGWLVTAVLRTTLTDLTLTREPDPATEGVQQ